jgi:ATP/maltotriose-dependent transcriptional regulator MalT
VADAAELGREAFARHAWAEAHAHLSAADPAEPTDLERLSVAAYLLGRDDEATAALERAHLAAVRRGELADAARHAFWLGLLSMLRGQLARGGGWVATAERLVEEVGEPCAAQGYLLVMQSFTALEAGDPAAAERTTVETIELARRFGDPDLLALGLLDRGQALLVLGDTHRGMALLDEVMVAVTTGQVSPLVAGIAYCAVIDACMGALDLRRAAEWTQALTSWCAAQPDLVPYRGQCLVHRSQVLLAHGSWTDAQAEVERARQHLAEPPHPALGLACYQQGELHRLRGELAEAERAYRAAHELGREPAPGIALLRLAEGRVHAAEAAVRRMAEEACDQLDEPVVLAAAVEVLLAAGDLDAAGAASDRLGALATDESPPLLRAMAAYAAGTARLAAGDSRAALAALRRARAGWQDLDMPYDVARARLQLGRAYTALGDADSADLELAAARSAFQRLGARPDVARVEGLLGRPGEPPELTGRECEVLRLVATGLTNREVAAALVISEHTVARHLQNIFGRLGVSSRAAATAWAYEHGVV